jgi:hypothetical protein
MHITQRCVWECQRSNANGDEEAFSLHEVRERFGHRERNAVRHHDDDTGITTISEGSVMGSIIRVFRSETHERMRRQPWYDDQSQTKGSSCV